MKDINLKKMVEEESFHAVSKAIDTFQPMWPEAAMELMLRQTLQYARAHNYDWSKKGGEPKLGDVSAL